MRCEAKYLPQAENKFIYFVKAFFVRKASLFFALKLKLQKIKKKKNNIYIISIIR
jgi:hypothetical protein